MLGVIGAPHTLGAHHGPYSELGSLPVPGPSHLCPYTATCRRLANVHLVLGDRYHMDRIISELKEAIQRAGRFKRGLGLFGLLWLLGCWGHDKVGGYVTFSECQGCSGVLGVLGLPGVIIVLVAGDHLVVLPRARTLVCNMT